MEVLHWLLRPHPIQEKRKAEKSIWQGQWRLSTFTLFYKNDALAVNVVCWIPLTISVINSYAERLGELPAVLNLDRLSNPTAKLRHLVIFRMASYCR